MQWEMRLSFELHWMIVDACLIIVSAEQQSVLELTQLAGLDIREDAFLIVSFVQGTYSWTIFVAL